MIDFAHYEKVWQEGYEEGKKDAAPKWFPVSVLLPSKEDSYLVTVEYDGCDGKKKTVIVSDWVGAFGGRFKVHYTFSKARVTAWMPLPEPYEEEEE